jgi:hypothetical protein
MFSCKSFAKLTYPPTTPTMMFQMNVWAVIYMAIACAMTGEAYEAIAYCRAYPDTVKDLLLFGLSSAVGQNFIFYTITGPGPLVCATVTTTRKVSEERRRDTTRERQRERQ